MSQTDKTSYEGGRKFEILQVYGRYFKWDGSSETRYKVEQRGGEDDIAPTSGGGGHGCVQ